ncbi:hypothetical protein ACWDKQ_14135 [Saccharopolyspora sp. NPDC000995]
MTSPSGGGSEYIADHEHSTYEQRRQQYAGLADIPLVGDALTKALSRAQAAQQAAKYGQQQAAALSVDQELREKPSELGNTHYLSYGHAELARFVQENFDPAAVHDVGRIYHDHGQKFLDFAERIRQAAAKTQDTWEGAAGDAMRAHVTQLADHMSHSGNAAQLTGNQIGLQAEVGERARNSMPDVVEFDLKGELKDYVSDPNPFTAISRANAIVEKQQKSQAAHQEAAEVMSKMESDFGSAAAQTPAFVPAPRAPEEQTSTPPQQQQHTLGSIDSSISTSGKPSSTHSAWVGPTPSLPPHSPPSSPPVPPNSTIPVWQQGMVSPGPDTRWNPQTSQWERRNSYSGRWAPLAPDQQRPGPGGGPGAGGGRPGPGGAGRGGGMGGAGRIGGAGGSLGAGGRCGVGGLGAAGGATAGGTGAAGARGGAAMAGGGAAGRGQGGKSEQDEERATKYVLDTDEVWEDLGLPKVAPPVFGE